MMANSDLLASIVTGIRQFQSGDADLVALQTSIVGNGSALEGPSEQLLGGLRKAERDLEFIQHAMLASEQRSAALECLTELKGHLRAAGAPGLFPELPVDRFLAGIALDESADTAFIYLDDDAYGDVDRVVELDEGVSLSFDRSGRLVGLEVRSASERLALTALRSVKGSPPR